MNIEHLMGHWKQWPFSVLGTDTRVDEDSVGAGSPAKRPIQATQFMGCDSIPSSNASTNPSAISSAFRLLQNRLLPVSSRCSKAL